MRIGVYSTPPCLLGLLAIREGRSFARDGTAAQPVG